MLSPSLGLWHLPQQGGGSKVRKGGNKCTSAGWSVKQEGLDWSHHYRLEWPSLFMQPLMTAFQSGRNGISSIDRPRDVKILWLKSAVNSWPHSSWYNWWCTHLVWLWMWWSWCLRVGVLFNLLCMFPKYIVNLSLFLWNVSYDCVVESVCKYIKRVERWSKDLYRWIWCLAKSAVSIYSDFDSVLMHNGKLLEDCSLWIQLTGINYYYWFRGLILYQAEFLSTSFLSLHPQNVSVASSHQQTLADSIREMAYSLRWIEKTESEPESWTTSESSAAGDLETTFWRGPQTHTTAKHRELPKIYLPRKEPCLIPANIPEKALVLDFPLEILDYIVSYLPISSKAPPVSTSSTVLCSKMKSCVSHKCN